MFKENQNFWIAFEKKHLQLSQLARQLEKVINEISYHEQFEFEQNLSKLHRLRHLMNNEIGNLFKIEEEVVYPFLLKKLPESHAVIEQLLEGHQDLQHLIHDVCRAIDQEQVNLFIEEAPQLLEKINLHFTQENALFSELPPEALNIKEYSNLNQKMYQIERELVGVEMFA
jgi:hypothetical protein